MGLTEHVVSELGELQAEGAELLLGLGAKSVAASGPEAGDRGTNAGVVLLGELVDVARIADLALGGRVYAVDLGGGELLELGHLELLAQGVDAGMLQKLITRLVDLGDAGVHLELALAGNLLGEVVASVEELEEAADGIEVVLAEVDGAGLESSVREHVRLRNRN